MAEQEDSNETLSLLKNTNSNVYSNQQTLTNDNVYSSEINQNIQNTTNHVGNSFEFHRTDLLNQSSNTYLKNNFNDTQGESSQWNTFNMQRNTSYDTINTPLLPEFPDILSTDSIKMNINSSTIDDHSVYNFYSNNVNELESNIVTKSNPLIPTAINTMNNNMFNSWNVSGESSKTSSLPQSPNQFNYDVSINSLLSPFNIDNSNHMALNDQSSPASPIGNFNAMDAVHNHKFKSLPPGLIDDHNVNMAYHLKELKRRNHNNLKGALDKAFKNIIGCPPESQDFISSVGSSSNDLNSSFYNMNLDDINNNSTHSNSHMLQVKVDLNKLNENAEILRSLGFDAGDNSFDSSAHNRTGDININGSHIKKKVTRIRSRNNILDKPLDLQTNNNEYTVQGSKKRVAENDFNDNVDYDTRHHFELQTYIPTNNNNRKYSISSASTTTPVSSKPQLPAKRKKVVKACVPCRTAHVSCDEGRPCKRCKKRGMEHKCIDTPTRADRLAELSRQLKNFELRPKTDNSGNEIIFTDTLFKQTLRRNSEPVTEKKSEICAAAEGLGMLKSQRIITTENKNEHKIVLDATSSNLNQGINILKSLSSDDLSKLSKVIGESFVKSGIFDNISYENIADSSRNEMIQSSSSISNKESSTSAAAATSAILAAVNALVTQIDTSAIDNNKDESSSNINDK